MKEFCLDIDKLEKVASARNGGLACAVRRPEGFAKGTYFLLCAEFEDNTSWDIIIPHPDVIPQRKARNLSTDSSPRTSLERRKSAPRTPKLLSWSASPANDAGVVYFFVNSISGIQLFESTEDRPRALGEFRLVFICCRTKRRCRRNGITTCPFPGINDPDKFLAIIRSNSNDVPNKLH